MISNSIQLKTNYPSLRMMDQRPDRTDRWIVVNRMIHLNLPERVHRIRMHQSTNRRQIQMQVHHPKNQLRLQIVQMQQLTNQVFRNRQQ